MNTDVSSEVEVALDPVTAFEVFTSEIDYWWLRGPINNWDSARVREMRCEPGVGGRLLEIYDEAAGDILELARITAWEPGRLLAWDSAVDDVRVDVHFDATPVGTRVRMHATVPAGGRDAGGTSFVRVTPGWLGSWCRERDLRPHAVRETARLGVAIYYDRPVAAARWLRDTFGLAPDLQIPEDDAAGGWIEVRVGSGVIILLQRRDRQPRTGVPTHAPWVFVDDVDAHLQRARDAGAMIVSEIEQHGYRVYEAADLEGNRWTFAQARPTMEPA
jgi:uncharacterized glyoxalase superfamily protein PhnB